VLELKALVRLSITNEFSTEEKLYSRYHLPDSALRQYCLSLEQTTESHSFALKSDQPIISKVSPELWHYRLGHAGQETIQYLNQAANGVEFKSATDKFKFKQCPTCQISNSKRQISRRPINQGSTPFETMHWDLIHLKKGIRNMKYISHLYCPYSKYHLGESLKSKDQASESLTSMLNLIKNQFKISPKRFHSDQDKNLNDFYKICRSDGIIINQSPIGQPEQNPYSERSGALITRKMRLLMADSGLPHHLWPEAANAAIYILNRTPNRQLQWKTPYEALYKALSEKPGYMPSKPDLSNLKRYGSRAYTRITSIPRLEKLKPRALIGYLVGYVALNIWRIWIPSRNKVISARDCIFDESKTYNQEPGQIGHFHDEDLGHDLEALNQLEFDEIINSIDTGLDSEDADLSESPISISDPDEFDHEEFGHESRAESLSETQSISSSETESVQNEASSNLSHSDQILGDQPDTPAASEPDSPPHVVIDNSQFNFNEYEKDYYQSDSIIGQKRDRSESPDLDDSKRPRNFALFTENSENDDFKPFFQAFSTGLQNIKKLHKNDLPPEPSNWTEMLKHPFKNEWIRACDIEYQQLNHMNTWTPVPKNSIDQAEVLPLKWVFKYKFDDQGFLSKFKARICVRGDL
jgi:hypothetical protein